MREKSEPPTVVGGLSKFSLSSDKDFTREHTSIDNNLQPPTTVGGSDLLISFFALFREFRGQKIYFINRQRKLNETCI